MNLKKCLILMLVMLCSVLSMSVKVMGVNPGVKRNSAGEVCNGESKVSDEEDEVAPPKSKEKNQAVEKVSKRRRLAVKDPSRAANLGCSTAQKKFLDRRCRFIELGLRGISNPGTNCFMNAAIQQLYRYMKFKKYIQTIDVAEIKKAEFETESEFKQISELIECLRYVFGYLDNNECYNEVDFNKSLEQIRRIVMDSDVEQEDANEFMSRVFRKIHFLESVYQKKELSYAGELLRTLYENEPTVMFNLDLNDEVPTVQGCLDKYFSETTLDADNMYDSEKYGKIQAQEHMFLSEMFQDPKTSEIKRLESPELPETLIFNLSRYQYLKHLQRRIKVLTKIQLDPTLDLTNYCDDTVAGPKQYKLVGIICSVGRCARSGHYVSYVRQGKKWYLIDDERVYPVDPVVLTKDDLTRNAYVLRYERGTEDGSEEIEE